MKIQPYIPNFTGRYKVLLTEKEFEHFEEKILPILDELHNQEVNYFYGKTPFEYEFSDSLTRLAKANGVHYDWAIKNASRNGIKICDSDSNILWVTTGVKDTEQLSKYENKRDTRFDLNKRISTYKIWQENPNISSELLDVKATDMALKKESKAFFKFQKKYPFKKLKSAEDIIFQDAVKI